MRYIISIILFSASFSALPEDGQLTSVLSPVNSATQLQQEFEEFIHTVVANDTPGFAISIIINGEPVVTRGYGVSEMGGDNEINAETVFRLASLSKSIASAAVGVLVQKNQLQWDSKIADYLGFIRFKDPKYAQQLTVQHILSQRTGLVPHAYTNLIEENFSYKKILQKIHEVPFVCAPGTCYSYQNVVFSLVGDIIEIASNESFENIVEQNLFEPLNMENASYGLENFINTKNRATPHVWDYIDEEWVSVSVKENYYNFAPAAGANASIKDMHNWLLAQLGHYEDVIHSDTLKMMQKKHTKTTRNQAHYRRDYWQNLEGTYYGLGWRVFDYAGHQNFVHHGGYVQGTRAEIVFHPDLQMGMVFLTNSETRVAGKVVPTFLQLYSKHVLSQKRSNL